MGLSIKRSDSLRRVTCVKQQTVRVVTRLRDEDDAIFAVLDISAASPARHVQLVQLLEGGRAGDVFQLFVVEHTETHCCGRREVRLETARKECSPLSTNAGGDSRVYRTIMYGGTTEVEGQGRSEARSSQ